LLAYRELDDALGLTDLAGAALPEDELRAFVRDDLPSNLAQQPIQDPLTASYRQPFGLTGIT
jgi:hypothetical protein